MTCRITPTERLDAIADYIGCRRMVNEHNHVFARRLLIAIKEHVELFTYLHAARDLQRLAPRHQGCRRFLRRRRRSPQ